MDDAGVRMFPTLNTGLISGLSFTPDGRRLVFCCGMDAAVSVWNLVTGSGACQIHVNGAEGGPITVLPNGRAMVVQTYDPDNSPAIVVYDLHGHLIRKLPCYFDEHPAHANNGYGTTVALDSTGRYLITSGERQPETQDAEDLSHPETIVWNTRTWRQTDKLTHTTDLDMGQSSANRIPQNALPLSPSGRIIRNIPPPAPSPLAIRGDYPAADWWKRAAKSRYPDQFTMRSGRFFVRLSSDHTSRGQTDVWDLVERKQIWSAKMTDIAPLTAAVSPDGRELAVAGIGNYVHFFDLATGRPRAAAWCITDLARSVAYSPNGRVIAAGGGGSGTFNTGVVLLDARTHRILATLKLGFMAEKYFGESEKTHLPWSVALPDRSFLASESAIKDIFPPGQQASAAFIQRFNRPARVRAALHACYVR